MYDSVETFVLFVGYARSGHSLIAAILDSHPEIIIANEFHILENSKHLFKDPKEESYIRRLWIFSALHSLSYSQSIQGLRSPKNRSGYSYYIPGGWQGKYRNQIKVSLQRHFIIITIFKLSLVDFNSLDANLLYFSVVVRFTFRRVGGTIKMGQN